MQFNANKNAFLAKDTSCQIKGLAIILIILAHLSLIWNYSGAIGVGIFLVLSGYGLVMSFYNNGLESFFKKRLLKVLLPYSIIQTLWILLDYFVKGKSYTLFQNILSILGLNVKVPIDGTMWFIPFIISWYLIFYIIFSLRIKDFYKIIIMFILAIVLNKFWHLFYEPSGAFLYPLIFPIGCFIGYLNSNINKLPTIIHGNKEYITIILAVVSIIATFLTYHNMINHSCYRIFAIAFSLLILLVFNFKIFKQLLEFFKLNLILKSIGEISFELYLIEGALMTKYNIFHVDISTRHYLRDLIQNPIF